jgi:hypothetical protein
MMNVFGAPVSCVESTHVTGDCLSVMMSSVVCVRLSTLIGYFRTEPSSNALEKYFPSEHAATTVPSMLVRELTSVCEKTWIFI